MDGKPGNNGQGGSGHGQGGSGHGQGGSGHGQGGSGNDPQEDIHYSI